jgi:hypothetical protein
MAWNAVDMKELIGKVIHKIYINEDDNVLKFIVENGEMFYGAVGDCCSRCWFNDILYPHLNDGDVMFVFDVKNLDGDNVSSDPSPKDEKYNDFIGACIDYHGIQIRTSKGDITITYRNVSNGYYKGSCFLMDDRYSELRDRHNREDTWREWKE